MEYRRMGDTGVKVSPLCLGAMMFGGWGNPDVAACERIIHASLDAGINFIDTANVYGRGESETIVGQALQGRRHEVVLATKVWGRMGDGPNDAGLSRRAIIEQCDASLRRLQTDWIDLYQIHRPDPETPAEETLSALNDLVRAGKVRYLGCSSGDGSGGDVPAATMMAWNMVDYVWLARSRGWEPFRCVQPPHSMLRRAVEAELLPAAIAHGLGIIPWSPLAGGWLTGKYQRGTDAPAGSRGDRVKAAFDADAPQHARKADVIETLLPVAADLGVSLTTLAIAWSMQVPGVTAPIIGPKTIDQLEDNLAALECVVPHDVLALVDDLVPAGTNA